MLSPQARQTLFASPWLRGLAEAEREEVVELLHEIHLPQGASIFGEGDRTDAGYLVVSGAVDILAGGQRVARLPVGESFGISAPADPRAAQARAALDCHLLVLPVAAWARFEELQPRAWEEQSRHLQRSLRVLLGRDGGPVCDVVLISSSQPWPERRTFVEHLAEALEEELDAPVAVATFASSGGAPPAPLRRNGLDFITAGDPTRVADLRARASAKVGELMGRVRFVLVDLDESLAEVRAGMEADVLVERVTGALPEETTRAGRRVIYVVEPGDGPGPSIASGDLIRFPADGPERANAFGRLARTLCGRTIGLALGSGAAWGMAHIGVLEVFEEAGLPVDVVAGASMGAIVGAHYALGITPAELREITTRIKTLPDLVGILPELLYLAADFNVTKPGMFAGEHFKRVLASIAPITGKTFADLQIPFRAIATDIESGARAELREGELSDAIHASFAAPWILSPHRIGDRVYIDGGMVDPVPSETVRRMGADLVVAVNVVPPVDADVRNPLDRAMGALGRWNPLARRQRGEERPLPGSFDVVTRTLQVMQYQLGNDRAGEADVLINPELREFWLLEFWSAAGMIERGAVAAHLALPQIQEKLSAWKKGPS